MVTTIRGGRGGRAGARCVLASLVALSLACVGGSGGSDDGSGAAGGAAPGGTPVDADLVASAISTTGAVVEAGAPFAVDVEVRNTGPAGVGAFRAALVLSADGVFGADDVEVFHWAVGGLSAGSAFAGSGAPTMPLGTAPGAWELLLVVDDDARYAETDESNNVLALTGGLTVEPPTHPDLEVEVVTFTPATVAAGDTIDVAHELRNVGVEAAGAFRVGVYLSGDPLITPGDLLIGQRPVGALAIGAVDAGSGALTVPQFTPPGVYHVGVFADDELAVVEMDESNNALAATATLTVTAPPLPNLVPTSFALSGPTSVDAGQPFLVDDQAANLGPADAPLFQVSVYLSEDATIDPATDVHAGTRTVAALAAGGTDAPGPWQVTVPSATAAGDWFVGVFVDSGEFVAESDEGDNALVAAASLTVTVPPRPDLVLDSFTTPGSNVVTADGSDSLLVTFSARNGGSAASPATIGTVYLSADAAVTPSDIPLGDVAVPALDPGDGAGQSLSLPVPGGIPSGSYRVGLWLDPQNVVAELNEGNNLVVDPELLDVVGGGPAEPNLVSELIDPSAMTAAPGGSVQVVTRVTNAGDITTPGFRIVVVLSTDETIEPTDTVIGSRLVPFGLGGGFNSVASAPATVPMSLPDGEYRIGVFADADDVVVESDEGDNGLARAGNFRVVTPPPPAPNLRVTSATFPANPGGAGATFDVSHEVENAGDLDASSFRVGIYLSDDQDIEPTDVLLGTRQLPSGIPSGGNAAGTTTVQIPTGLAAGTWYVGVIADDTDVVVESDEADNARRAPGEVVL